MPKLVFIDNNFSGQVYELVLEKSTVGRSNENTLVIPDDSVSSKHCEILVNGSEVIIRDLDSRNGTFVNSVRLNKQSQVKSGQIVRIGSAEARLELDPMRDESEATSITAVYAHKLALRDQRRAQKKPKPADPHKMLEASASPSEEEQTILIPNPARLAPASPSSGEPENVQPANKRTWIKLVVAALLALGIVGLIWLLKARN
jgi:pSer/pThr/pTyr-binding forkhead associated (FHA) protein